MSAGTYQTSSRKRPGGAQAHHCQEPRPSVPEVRRNVAWLTISVRHRAARRHGTGPRIGTAPGRASAWHRAARRHAIDTRLFRLDRQTLRRGRLRGGLREPVRAPSTAALRECAGAVLSANKAKTPECPWSARRAHIQHPWEYLAPVLDRIHHLHLPCVDFVELDTLAAGSASTRTS